VLKKDQASPIQDVQVAMIEIKYSNVSRQQVNRVMLTLVASKNAFFEVKRQKNVNKLQ